MKCYCIKVFYQCVVYSDIILAVCFAMRCCISYRLFFERYLPGSGKRPSRTEHSVAAGGVTSEATRPDRLGGLLCGAEAELRSARLALGVKILLDVTFVFSLCDLA